MSCDEILNVETWWLDVTFSPMNKDFLRLQLKLVFVSNARKMNKKIYNMILPTHDTKKSVKHEKKINKVSDPKYTWEKRFPTISSGVVAWLDEVELVGLADDLLGLGEAELSDSGWPVPRCPEGSGRQEASPVKAALTSCSALDLILSLNWLKSCPKLLAPKSLKWRDMIKIRLFPRKSPHWAVDKLHNHGKSQFTKKTTQHLE